MVKLGDICTVVSGSTPSSSVAEYWDGNHIWITPAELSDDSFIIYDSARHITDRAIQETSLKPFPEGTVILSSRAPIGKTAIAGCKMYCNQGFKNLICSDSIYNKYLYFFLSAKTNYLNSLGRGATFKEISKHIVENIQIYLPTIEEQKKRAGILEKLIFLIQTRKQQLSKLDQLVKSRFIEMFGDPVINTKKFPVFRMDEVVKFVGGSQPDKKYFEYSPTPDNIRLIQIRDYKSDKFITYIPKSMAKRHCTADDIMIGRYGPPIRGNKEFIRYFLKQDALLHYLESLSSRTAGQDGIQMDKLKEYPFPFPPLIDQETFVTFTKQVEKAKSSIKQSLEKLETLKKSLMQEYFG